MDYWTAAYWGASGGLMVEAVQFLAAIRRTGDWPWRTEGEPKPLPLLVSVVIRLGLGFGLAMAAAQTEQISGPLGAIAVGIAAPLMVEQMAKQVPLQAESDAEVRG